MLTTAGRDEVADLIRAGRRSQRRRKTLLKVIEALLTTVVASLAGGFELMLAVTVAHAAWVPQLPTIGYWWAVLIVTLLRGTFSAMRSSSTKDSTS